MEYNDFQSNFFSLLIYQEKKCLKYISENEDIIEKYFNVEYPETDTHLESNNYVKSFVDELNTTLLKKSHILNFDIVESVLKHKLFDKVYEDFKNSEILIEACKAADINLIKWLTTMDINLMVTDNEGLSAFMHAVKHDSLSQLYEQLTSEDAINIVDKDGNNAIIHAIHNQKALLFFLTSRLGRKINVNHFNNNHETPILYCVKNGILESISSISYLIDVDFNVQDDKGWTVPMYLIDRNLSNYLIYLKRIDFDIRSKVDNECVMTILIKKFEKLRENYNTSQLEKLYTTIQFLVNKNWNFNIAIDEEGNSPLQYFIMIEDYGTIYYLIKRVKTLDLSFKNKNGDDAYTLALKLNNRHIVRFFDRCGVYYYDYTDRFHNNLLMLYTITNNPKMVAHILTHNEDIINKVNDKKETALIMATKLGNNRIIKSLTLRGSDVNMQDYLGNTALYYAVDLLNYEAVQMLMNYKADPNIKNNRGKSAFDLAHELQDELLLDIMHHPEKMIDRHVLKKAQRAQTYPSPNKNKIKKNSKKSQSLDPSLDVRTFDTEKYRNDSEFFINDIKGRYPPFKFAGMKNLAYRKYGIDYKRKEVMQVVGIRKKTIVSVFLYQALFLYLGFALA